MPGETTTVRLAAMGLHLVPESMTSQDAFDRTLEYLVSLVPFHERRVLVFPEFSIFPLLAAAASQLGFVIRDGFVFDEPGHRTFTYELAWKMFNDSFSRLARTHEAVVIAGGLRPVGHQVYNVAAIFDPYGVMLTDVREVQKVGIGDVERQRLGIIEGKPEHLGATTLYEGVTANVVVCFDAFVKEWWEKASADLFIQVSANPHPFDFVFDDARGLQSRDWVKSMDAVASGVCKYGACAMLTGSFAGATFDGPSYVVVHSDQLNPVPFPGLTENDTRNLKFLGISTSGAHTYGHRVTWADVEV